jgi:hypothetical protein
MRRRVLATLFLACFAMWACRRVVTFSAANIWISQASLGTPGSTGTDCNNTLAVSFFNTAGNWGAGASQIGDNSNVHLCGTITTNLTWQASASVGNPTKLIFEAGSKISQPWCGSPTTNDISLENTGCIDIHGKSNIIIDCGGTWSGGVFTPKGIIEATANGTGLANQHLTNGIFADSTTNVEIKGCLIQNMYVHKTYANITSVTGNGSRCDVVTATAFPTVVGEPMVGIRNNALVALADATITVSTDSTHFSYACANSGTGAGGTVADGFPNNPYPDAVHADSAPVNFSFHDGKINDANWSLYIANGGNTFNVYNMEFYNTDHALAVGTGAANMDLVNFHDSYVHDPAPAWETGPDLNKYHHDGIHTYQNSGGIISNINVYNNLFGGDWGANNTAFTYTEGTAFTEFLWNNMGLPGSNRNLNNGCWSLTVGPTGTAKAWNNTCIGTSGQSNALVKLEGTTVDYRNNVTQGGSALFYLITFGGSAATFNNNVWGTTGSVFYDCTGACTFVNYATFKSHLPGGSGQDAAGTQVAGAGLNSSGVPQAGSAVIGIGADLSGLGISTLNSDSSVGLTHTPVLRTVPWDAGALKFGSGSTPPSPSSFIISAYPLPAAPTQPTILSVSPAKTYVTAKGCSQDGASWINPCIFKISCTNCSATTQVTLDGVAVTQTYAAGVMTSTVSLSVLGIPSTITQHNFSASNPGNIPILSRMGRK